MPFVEFADYEGGERGFAGAGDAADADEEALGGREGVVSIYVCVRVLSHADIGKRSTPGFVDEAVDLSFHCMGKRNGERGWGRDGTME